jgi:hypothetical protein
MLSQYRHNSSLIVHDLRLEQEIGEQGGFGREAEVQRGDSADAALVAAQKFCLGCMFFLLHAVSVSP